MKRCKWVNLKNPAYIAYHDNEWGKPLKDDKILLEMFLLECFQAGLSWEIILNKREYFRKAYDNFDLCKIVNYGEQELQRLYNDKNIIRNKLKINASISNAKVFKSIKEEWGSFSNYIWHFTNGEIILNKTGEYITSSKLSDTVSLDLKKRGAKFVGTVTIYSFLQAIGVINDHELDCDFRF